MQSPRARRRGAIRILVDTVAGRLHTRVNLMNELEKIRRIAAREVAGAPQEVLLVLDATVGQNGVAQAREFMGVAGVNGIILTKLDGTAKGGVAVAIAHDLKLPIRYVGVGEGIDDLVPFSADEYVDGLFAEKMVERRRYMDRALFHTRRAAPDASPAPTRWLARWWPWPTASWSGRASISAAGEAHAEVHALDRGRRKHARGATLYCTLEPCCHQGRTGPCVSRIVDAGVARVVAAVEDPNPAVRGRGFAFLRERGVVVDVGLAAATAVTLNQPFFTLMREGRPFVTLKAATSIDGRIAEAAGCRTSLTSAIANRHAHRVRAEVDAIGVGSGTILADDPGADGARRLSRAPAGPRHFRPPAADLPASPRALDTRRRGLGHHRDQRLVGGARRPAQAARSARRPA